MKFRFCNLTKYKNIDVCRRRHNKGELLHNKCINIYFKEYLKIKDQTRVLVTINDDTKRKETAEILASQFNELQKLTDTALQSLQDNLTEIDTILEQLEAGGWDEKKIETLSEFETKAEKNVISAFTNLRKRETHIEIKDLNRISNGGVVFITGKILAGTAINVRRSRFNVPVTATDKAHSVCADGVILHFGKELLQDYQQYFFRMPA